MKDIRQYINVKKAIKDIEQNHNHSLYLEILERNKDNLDSVAINYRGTDITYRKLFDEIIPSYVKSFQNVGIGKDSEIPICMSNIPELIFLVLAASYVGAKINIFGTEFEDSYKTEIINKCDSPYIFVSDDVYAEVKDSIKNSKIQNIVMISLVDSIKGNIDPYYDIDKKYCDFSNKVSSYKVLEPNILSQQEFIAKGKNEKLQEPNHGSLDDILSTTYSSGSTNSARPKGIVHINKSYIMMGRSHDTDLSNAPSMHGLRVLAMIPTHSNTNLMSNITDTLIQGSCVIPEPIGNPEFLLDSFIINKPNFCTATRSLIIRMAKKILYDENYKNTILPSLFALFSVGEPTTENEEKFINKALQKAKAGKLWYDKVEKKFIGKLPVWFPISIAGGDCEHGGIFYTMFKSWAEKKERLLGHLSKNERMGMSTHQIVSTIILDENGKQVQDGQIGRLYATSECNMLCYRDNQEATDKFFKVINGVKYGDCSALAVRDRTGRIDLKGRIYSNLTIEQNKNVIKVYDTILKDTKNILSCEVIPQVVNDECLFIAHIELQPEKRLSATNTIKSAEERCIKLLGPELSKNVYYRLHGNNTSFALTGCGKRNNNILKQEGITEQCIKPLLVDGNIEIMSYYDINKENDNEKNIRM